MRGLNGVHFMRGCSATRSNLGRIAPEAFAPVWNRVLPTSAIRPLKKEKRADAKMAAFEAQGCIGAAGEALFHSRFY